jgi:Ser/Thr protein kinase RdoA (MazF antagonist)
MQPDAILYSTISAEAIRQMIVRPHYGYANSVECTLFNAGQNDTYQVRAADHIYALRLYRTGRSLEGITEELAALLQLRAKEVPVAAPIARLDGEFVTPLDAPEGTRFAALFHWVGGEQPRYINAAHATLYGRVAARLHSAADDMPVPAGDSLASRSVRGPMGQPGGPMGQPSNKARPPHDMGYLLDRPAASLRPAIARYPSWAARFEALIERLKPRLEQARERLTDWGFCHGDLHGGNAHVAGDQLHLFDFDFCGAGWRVYDLATYRWAARLRGVEDRAWKPFSAAYLQSRPAAASDLELAPLFVILREIWLQGYFASRTARSGDGFQDERYFEHVVTFCERAESELTGS